MFNTEAHAFPRFEMGKLFTTGWDRGKYIPRRTADGLQKDVRVEKKTVVVEKIEPKVIEKIEPKVVEKIEPQAKTTTN